jgi:hypothetical protein
MDLTMSVREGKADLVRQGRHFRVGPNPDLVTLLPMPVGLNGWQLAFTQLVPRHSDYDSLAVTG